MSKKKKAPGVGQDNGGNGKSSTKNITSQHHAVNTTIANSQFKKMVRARNGAWFHPCPIAYDRWPNDGVIRVWMEEQRIGPRIGYMPYVEAQLGQMSPKISQTLMDSAVNACAKQKESNRYHGFFGIEYKDLSPEVKNVINMNWADDLTDREPRIPPVLDASTVADSLGWELCEKALLSDDPQSIGLIKTVLCRLLNSDKADLSEAILREFFVCMLEKGVKHHA